MLGSFGRKRVKILYSFCLHRRSVFIQVLDDAATHSLSLSLIKHMCIGTLLCTCPEGYGDTRYMTIIRSPTRSHRKKYSGAGV